MKRQGNRGFTLIELMIVVVIISILAAIAYPSYRNQVIKGNRAAAKSYLMALAGREEQYMLDARSYSNSVASGAGGLNFPAPQEVSNYYQVAVINVSSPPPAYTLTLNPIPGSMQASDGWIALDSTGNKTSQYPGKW